MNMIFGGDPHFAAIANTLAGAPVAYEHHPITPEKEAALLAWYKGEGRRIFDQPKPAAEAMTHEL